MHKFKTIYLEITNLCNLQCPFCPSHILKQNDFMTKETFIKIVNEIVPYTKSLYFHMKGEPLVHPLFNDFMDYCNQLGLTVNISTNGVLLNKWPLIEKANLKKINISLQCMINFNDDTRKIYLDNIYSFLMKKEEVNKHLGVNLRIWNNKSDQETIKLNTFIKNYFKDNPLNFTNVHLSEAEEFIWPDLNQPINPCNTRCLGGITHLGILVDGTVTICCLDHLGISNLGNIVEQSLKEILCSEKYQKTINDFRNNLSYLPICQRCTYRNRFKHKEVRDETNN